MYGGTFRKVMRTVPRAFELLGVSFMSSGLGTPSSSLSSAASTGFLLGLWIEGIGPSLSTLAADRRKSRTNT